jgi:hypothetical protein
MFIAERKSMISAKSAKYLHTLYVVRGDGNEDEVDVVCRFRSDGTLLIMITVYRYAGFTVDIPSHHGRIHVGTPMSD